jgi:hypothetical protein
MYGLKSLGENWKTGDFVVGAPAFPGSPAAKLLGWIRAGGRSASALRERFSTLIMRFSAGNARVLESA